MQELSPAKAPGVRKNLFLFGLPMRMLGIEEFVFGVNEAVISKTWPSPRRIVNRIIIHTNNACCYAPRTMLLVLDIGRS